MLLPLLSFIAIFMLTAFKNFLIACLHLSRGPSAHDFLVHPSSFQPPNAKSASNVTVSCISLLSFLTLVNTVQAFLSFQFRLMAGGGIRTPQPKGIALFRISSSLSLRERRSVGFFTFSLLMDLLRVETNKQTEKRVLLYFFFNHSSMPRPLVVPPACTHGAAGQASRATPNRLRTYLRRLNVNRIFPILGKFAFLIFSLLIIRRFLRQYFLRSQAFVSVCLIGFSVIYLYGVERNSFVKRSHS